MISKKGLPRSIKLFLIVSLVGNFAALVVSYVLVNYLNSDPSLAQLSPSNDLIGYLPELEDGGREFSVGIHFFGDFLEPFLKTLYRAPYTELSAGHRASNYPPLVHLFLVPFTWIPYRIALATYLALGLITVLVPMMAIASKHALADRLLYVGGAAFSVPVLFSLDRGNIWCIAIGLAVGSLVLSRRGYPTVSALILGLAVSLKLFPIVFFLWLYRKHGLRTTTVGLMSALIMSGVSLLYFKGNSFDNLYAFVESQRFVHANIDTNFIYQRVNSSLIALMNNFRDMSFPPFRHLGSVVLDRFLLLCAACFAYVIRVSLRVQLTAENEVYLLLAGASMASLLSPTVFVYSYLLFLVPLALIMYEKVSSRYVEVTSVLIGLLYVNKVPFTSSTATVTAFNTINPLICATILLLTIRKVAHADQVQKELRPQDSFLPRNRSSRRNSAT